MPIDNTLSKFGVPLENGNAAGVFATKRNDGFRVIFQNFGDASDQNLVADLTANIATFSHAEQQFEIIELPSYMSTGYISSRHTIGTVSMTIRDTLDNAVSRMVQAQVQRQANRFTQSAVLTPRPYFFNLLVSDMDGGNNGEIGTTDLPGDSGKIQTSFYEGCFITNVSFSQRDYSTGSAATIDLTIRPNNLTIYGFNEATLVSTNTSAAGFVNSDPNANDASL